MISFSEFPYRRIDFADIAARFVASIASFESAPDAATAYYALIEMDYLQRVFVNYATLSEAGATNDSFDAFWQEEEQFFGKAKPEFENLIQRRNVALCSSPHQAALKKLLGQEFFDRVALQCKTINCAALPIMQKENELSRRYSLLASQLSAKDGEDRLTLPEISRRGASSEHETRRKYAMLAEQTYESIADELDVLFDEMVKVRTDISHATGFENLTDYCLSKHGRTGYGRAEIKRFADGVEKTLVPLVNELFQAQESRLGHAVMNYDEGTPFPSRAVAVAEDPVPAFSRIFAQLSPETKVFFDELSERKFFDLEPRAGKTMGAYSNYVPLCQMPYLFETYNATEGAVRTFAHECGHGLHSFLHRGEPIMDVGACSSDLSETHSMSMEFFVWRYLDEIIYKEDLPLYQYRHLQESLVFISYGTAIDCFQTEVYDHPDMTSTERLELWKRLERRFLPWRKYETGGFLDQGRAWQRQIHVMKWPFYYIDYVLAQVCALQFFVLDLHDHNAAWDTYIQLLKASGQMSFPETIRRVGLLTPFDEGVIGEIARSAKAYMATLGL